MKVVFPYFLLVFLIAIKPSFLKAQVFTIDSSKKSLDVSGDFKDVEIQLPAVKKLPEFPGGKPAWQKFLLSQIDIKVPFANKAIPGKYSTMVRFVVRSDGKLSGIGADSNCGYGMEEEVIRSISKSNLWIPAETNSGKKVSFIMRTIVIFTVKQNDVAVSFQ